MKEKLSFLERSLVVKKMNFPLNFRNLPFNGQGTSKNAYIFKFLIDPIVTP